jgi:hypothetical protein
MAHLLVWVDERQGVLWRLLNASTFFFFRQGKKRLTTPPVYAREPCLPSGLLGLVISLTALARRLGLRVPGVSCALEEGELIVREETYQLLE